MSGVRGGVNAWASRGWPGGAGTVLAMNPLAWLDRLGAERTEKGQVLYVLYVIIAILVILFLLRILGIV